MERAREYLGKGKYSSAVGSLGNAMIYLEYPEQGWKDKGDWEGSVREMKKIIDQASENPSELKSGQAEELASYKKTVDAELDPSKEGPIVQKARRDLAKGRDLGTLMASRRGRGHGHTKLFLFSGILGVIVGLLFLSSNITGNVIGNLTNSTSSVIGVILLCVGLVTGFFYFRDKKKK